MDDVQDFIFLAEARPVLVRMHVQVDGLPLQAAHQGFQKYLFTYLDVNGDGALSKEEAERIPTPDQILTGGLGGGLGGGFGGRGARAPAQPSFDSLDADKDGTVSPAELTAYYRKSGFTPFQFQLGGAGTNTFGIPTNILGGPRPEPPVSVVSEAVFALVDTNKDGKLSKEELAAVPAALLRLDEDEDEIVTPVELTPNYRAPGAAMFGAMMAGQPNAGPASSNTLVPIPTPGEAPAELVRRIQERYGPKADKPEEKKLSRKDLGLDEALFGRLDADEDGLLDGAELAGIVKRRPDLELVIHLGKKDQSKGRVELAAADGRPFPLASKVKIRQGVALLDLGVTRVDLRGTEDDQANPYADLIRQQFIAQLKQADADNNGWVDESEAKNNRLLRGLFKMIDRDGDGKVYEKELNAFFDHARDLQARAQSGCANLVLQDQSRGLFDLMDANRDGRLGLREIRAVPKLLEQLPLGGKDHITKDDIPKSYRLAVRSGPADSTGFGNAMVVVAGYFGGGGGAGDYRPTAGPIWFRKMDRNGDGDVSRKEFLGADEQFRRLDQDGDGLISLEEADKADAQLRKESRPGLP